MNRYWLVFLALTLAACNLSDPEADLSVGANNSIDIEEDAGNSGNGDGGANNATTPNSTTPNEVLEVVTVTPEDGEGDVNLGSTVTFIFSEQLDLNTITRNDVVVSNDSGPVEVVSLVADGANVVVDFTPLETGMTYTVELPGTVASLDGLTLGEPFETSFSTVPAFELVSVTPTAAEDVDVATTVEFKFSTELAATASDAISVTLELEPNPIPGMAFNPTFEVRGDTIRVTSPAGRWREFRTTHRFIVTNIESADGRVLDQVETRFVTKMFDPDAIYWIRNESRSQFELLLAESPNDIFVTQPDQIEDAGWTFIEVDEDLWQVQSVLYSNLFLESGDGSIPAELTAGAGDGMFFTGQLWRFNEHPIEGRLPRDTNTSFYSYYMQSEFQGPNRALELENQRARIQDLQNIVRQSWHFERATP